METNNPRLIANNMFWQQEIIYSVIRYLNTYLHMKRNISSCQAFDFKINPVFQGVDNGM